MIVLAKKSTETTENPTMSRAELESEWHMAKERFNIALAQKRETDRTYVAAATELNSLERMVKKAEQRDAQARREATRGLSGKAYPSR